MEKFVPWVALAASLLTPVVLFVGRNWLRTYIERRVSHGFDREIEKVRTDLRSSEERLKSDLRQRESEIASLRDGVLSGRANRNALVDKRRIEAVEKLWVGVTKLSRMQWSSSTLAILKIEELAKSAPHDGNLREFLKVIAGPDLSEQIKELRAGEERPFVSPLAWALYSAYSTIILGAYAQLRTLASGVSKPLDLLDTKRGAELIKAVLPHRADYIDAHGPSAHHYLLEEIEGMILDELRAILDGSAHDEANAKKTADILDRLSGLREADAKRAAEVSAAAAGIVQ